MSLRVLLVEDDRELRHTLRDALAVEGYEVITATSLSETVAILQHDQQLDLLLVDLGLPDGDGTSLLIQWRKKITLPIIVLSARDQENQKIQLLDLGADDYLVKPFGVGELLARMRVALRHKGTPISAAITDYCCNDLVINLVKRRVEKAGRELHLTPTEFSLLALLVRNAGRVLTHRQLLADVWGADYIDHTHYLRLYMAQLRGKIETNSSDPQFLLTEPGVGYRLVEPDTV